MGILVNIQDTDDKRLMNLRRSFLVKRVNYTIEMPLQYNYVIFKHLLFLRFLLPLKL